MDETIPITYKGKVLAKAKADATKLFLARMGIEDIRDIGGLDLLPNLKDLCLHTNSNYNLGQTWRIAKILPGGSLEETRG